MPWNAPSRPHPTRMVGVAEPLGISYLPRRRGYREGPPARKPTPRLITTAQRWFRRSAGNTPRRSVCCRTTRCTLSACMQGATECRVSRRRPIPLVIRASIRVLRFIMAVPKAGGSRRRRRPLVVISSTRRQRRQTVNPCCRESFLLSDSQQRAHRRGSPMGSLSTIVLMVLQRAHRPE
jgi:hypothetical protein